MKTSDSKRFQARREQYLIDAAECVWCGSMDDIEWDHIDPSSKTHYVSWLLRFGSDEMLAEEMAKVQPLCIACHRNKYSVYEMPDGTQRRMKDRTGNPPPWGARWVGWGVAYRQHDVR